MQHEIVDWLTTDVVTGQRTRFGEHAHAALSALNDAELPYAVIGAVALAARGLPRQTRDIDVVVLVDTAFAALDALATVGFRSAAPVDRGDEPEPMYVLVHDDGSEIDLLVAVAEPESMVIAEAGTAEVFGARAPVATLEHLVLLYLYSNQPRHFADLARIVTETEVDLAAVESYLREVHPEMLPVLRAKVEEARHPPPPPPRPSRRRLGDKR